MEDEEIVELLYVHEEGSLEKVSDKYGNMLYNLSNGILYNEQDAEECVNDTYMKVWDTIPPYKPTFFKSFICKLVRQISEEIDGISVDFYTYENHKYAIWEDNDFTYSFISSEEGSDVKEFVSNMIAEIK